MIRQYNLAGGYIAMGGPLGAGGLGGSQRGSAGCVLVASAAVEAHTWGYVEAHTWGYVEAHCIISRAASLELHQQSTSVMGTD